MELDLKIVYRIGYHCDSVICHVGMLIITEKGPEPSGGDGGSHL